VGEVTSLVVVFLHDHLVEFELDTLRDLVQPVVRPVAFHQRESVPAQLEAEDDGWLDLRQVPSANGIGFFERDQRPHHMKMPEPDDLGLGEAGHALRDVILAKNFCFLLRD
jgi:hypothetical protein